MDQEDLPSNVTCETLVVSFRAEVLFDYQSGQMIVIETEEPLPHNATEIVVQALTLSDFMDWYDTTNCCEYEEEERMNGNDHHMLMHKTHCFASDAEVYVYARVCQSCS
jgi:hypothetical protein